jgi:membrane dipeptidase
MHLIVDAHEDLAWNALNFGRDYSRSALETRQAELNGDAPRRNGNTLLGLPEYLDGHVAVIFSTLFVAPARSANPTWEAESYSNAEQAHLAANRQLDYYHRLADDHEQFKLIGGRGDLEQVLASWKGDDPAGRRVGLVPLMEGADPIREPQEAEWWMERGIRIVGLAWASTRYSGGTGEPGPLTSDGRRLLEVMAGLGLILDLSHASDESYLEAIDRFEGTIIVSHANPRALLKDFPRPERMLTDEMIERVAEAGGVIGVVPFNRFLKSTWQPADGKAGATLSDVLDMIDHVCQVTGSADHVGLGSDFDGGFGVERTPAEIDTVADLQKLDAGLRARGYAERDIGAILGQNWVAVLRRGLPA